MGLARTLRGRWRSITAAALVGLALAAVASLLWPPTWASHSTVFVTLSGSEQMAPGEPANDTGATDRIVASFLELARTEKVLGPAAATVGVPAAVLAEAVTVTVPAGTQLIQFEARSRSIDDAATWAEAVADSLDAAVAELFAVDANGHPVVDATVVERRSILVHAVTPRTGLLLPVGLGLGLVVGLGQAALRRPDTRVFGAADLADLAPDVEVPVLGIIGADGEGVDAAETQEDYRKLRTSIGLLGLGDGAGAAVVVSSSVADEGRTTTAVSLAQAMARAGESVILVDADLRSPGVASALGLSDGEGLVGVLTGESTFDDEVRDLVPGFLAVLPAGTAPHNPSELLGTAAMADLLAELVSSYDYVLLDSPALLPVTDAVVLGAQSAGVLLVARAGVVRREEVRDAVAVLEGAKVPVLGVVVNGVA